MKAAVLMLALLSACGGEVVVGDRPAAPTPAGEEGPKEGEPCATLGERRCVNHHDAYACSRFFFLNGESLRLEPNLTESVWIQSGTCGEQK